MGGDPHSIGELRRNGKNIGGTILLRTWKGDNLVEKNKITGKSDPYLVFTLIQGSQKTEIYKTEVVKDTICPRWNNEITKNIKVEEYFQENSTLLVECFDFEKLGHHHHMGIVTIHIDDLVHDANNDLWAIKDYPLESHRDGTKVSGSLTLTILYNNNTLWKEDEPVREAVKNQKKQDEAEAKKLKEQEEKKKEEGREEFIARMQARSREEELQRAKKGEDKVQYYYNNPRERVLEQQEENLRSTNYQEYAKVCKSQGRKPLPEESTYEPHNYSNIEDAAKPLTDVLHKQLYYGAPYNSS